MSIRQIGRLGGACILILGLCTTLFATPYWTPEQIAAEYARSGAATAPRIVLPQAHHGSSLDEPAYFLHYRMLCDFLVSMQYTSAGPDFGGMIEGESGGDSSIIQTDNTQEAIRIWSQYAIFTGDTARYAVNIRRAWIYCENYPAWREEGGGYYAAHNCGWGFEAVHKYRQAYADTSFDWYADSCATWAFANPVPFNPNSTNLDQVEPLSEGLAIGGMYPHALYRGRTDWQNFTLAQARRLRTWFESNPARLNANEAWALCGGTALWGVCQSLFTQYPDSGQTWLAQYGPQLDTWQSVGTWNHSSCTWYANAQYAVWEITHDSTYWRNGVSITDSLIGLDTDHDGGIYPGRELYSPANDHSWVSSYMGWMGMERIITAAPITDAAVLEMVSPDPGLPHLAGDSLTLCIHIANGSPHSLSLWLHARGANYRDSLHIALATGADSIVTLPHRWFLPDNAALPPVSHLALSVVAANDGNPENDTLTVAFDMRRSVAIAGLARTSDGLHELPGIVEFFHAAYPDSVWSTATIDVQGHFTGGSQRLMAGQNTLAITPALPYMLRRETVNLIPGPEPQAVEVVIPPAAVVLVDDDVDSTYERFYESSLDSLHLSVRRWDVAASGSTPDLTPIPAISTTQPTVIWFTGNDAATTLDAADITNLTDYLSIGGHLLLTGQNITDLPAEQQPFLTNVLHCSPRTADVNSFQVWGVPGGLMAGDSLLLIGASGAYNQTSPASVNVLAGSTGIFRYHTSPDEICGVIGEYESGRYMFLSFGLEAVSGAGVSMRRDQFLARAFAWFGDSLSAINKPVSTPLANDFVLEFAYPNPFNPSTTIRFRAPLGAQNVRLELFNVLGQKVRTLYAGTGTGQMMDVLWDGQTDAAAPVSSGVFLCRLVAADQAARVQTLRLVR